MKSSILSRLLINEHVNIVDWLRPRSNCDLLITLDAFKDVQYFQDFLKLDSSQHFCDFSNKIDTLNMSRLGRVLMESLEIMYRLSPMKYKHFFTSWPFPDCRFLILIKNCLFYFKKIFSFFLLLFDRTKSYKFTFPFSFDF